MRPVAQSCVATVRSLKPMPMPTAMKTNERGANFFLKLLILRERRQPETRRLVIRLHTPKPVAIPIRFPRYPTGAN